MAYWRLGESGGASGLRTLAVQTVVVHQGPNESYSRASPLRARSCPFPMTILSGERASEDHQYVIVTLTLP